MPQLDWQEQVEEFRRDNRSGAEELTSQALELLIDEIGDSVPAGVLSYRSWLLGISRDLVAAQPSMGSIFRLVNDMLWATHSAMNAQVIREQALDHLQAVRDQRETALWDLTQTAVEELPQVAAVMTYSRSSTVLRALTAVAEAGHRPRVYCSESRPMLEGQTLANELGWLGLEVVVGIDMALFGWLHEIDLLLIGADSLSREGLVNKLGTAALVREAMRCEVPCAVLCTTTKFLPDDYMLSQNLRSGDPEEIMPVPSAQVDIRNVYYDVTPLDFVSRVITEKGVLSGDELDDELGQVKTYPGLRGR